MLGIIDSNTGKVFAKSKRHTSEFQKLLSNIEIAYPSKKFKIVDVDDNAKCVGDLPKTVEKVKGS